MKNDSLSVLVVEDDRTIRRQVMAELRRKANVLQADNAGKALKIYEEEKPELVLMDIMLPDADGKALLQCLKENDPDAFVVMFSDYHGNDNVLPCLEMGAEGFISKPYDPKKMDVFLNRRMEQLERA